jgi:ribonuclease P protein component
LLVTEALSRRARLSGRDVFDSLLRSRSARGERFVVHAVGNGSAFARLGIVVSKRVARRAVDRSYLKRLIRETFRREQTKLAGFDVLVRPRRLLSRVDAAAATTELRSLLATALR